MSGGWKIGVLAGIPVVIAPSAAISAFLIFWALGAHVFPVAGAAPGWLVWAMAGAGTAVFFASLLAHEFAHSLVAQRAGLTVRRIVLFVFGGVSESADEMPGAGVEFRVAIAGPLTSIGLAGVYLGLERLATPFSAPVAMTLHWLSIVNLGIGLFNLLPGFPLDGGRVLRAALWAGTGDFMKAARWATVGGKGVALLLGLWALWHALVLGDFFGLVWIGLIAMMLFNAAEAAYQQAVLQTFLARVRVRDVMRRDVHALGPDLTLEDAVSDVLSRYGEPAYPVVAEDRSLQGILTPERVAEVPRSDWPAIRVSELMRPIDDSDTVAPDQEAAGALRQMAGREDDELLVVDGGRVVGIIGAREVASFLKWKSG